jgi:hypothetical protein
MAKHKDFKLPKAEVEIIKIGEWFRLKINGELISEDSLKAKSEKALEKFVRIYQAKLDKFAYYKPNHSILTQVAGRKGGHQQSEILQWQEEGLYLA